MERTSPVPYAGKNSPLEPAQSLSVAQSAATVSSATEVKAEDLGCE